MNPAKILFFLLLASPMAVKSQDSFSVKIIYKLQGDNKPERPEKFLLDSLYLTNDSGITRKILPDEIYLNDTLYIIPNLPNGIYWITCWNKRHPYYFDSPKTILSVCSCCKNTFIINYTILYLKPGEERDDENKVYSNNTPYNNNYAALNKDLSATWTKRQLKNMAKKKFTITGFFAKGTLCDAAIIGDELTKKDRALILKSLPGLTNWKQYLGDIPFSEVRITITNGRSIAVSFFPKYQEKRSQVSSR